MKVDLKPIYSELRMSCNSDATFTIIEMIEELYKEAYIVGYKDGVNYSMNIKISKLDNEVRSIIFDY